jgi:hypothetical protein
MTARTYGGAVRRSESTSPLWRVETTVLNLLDLMASKLKCTYGKKVVTLPDATIPKRRTRRTYVFMSINASFIPWRKV